MQLSRNFSLEELTESTTADRLHISNQPDEQQLIHLTLLCERILQPLRDELRESITINSGLRNNALNQAVGGSKTSDHCKGLAADIQCSNNKKLFDTIIKMNLPFKQLIWEFGNENQPKWVHVALDLNDIPKRQVLRAISENNKTKYINII